MSAFIRDCLFDFLRCAPARLQFFVPVLRLALNSTFSTCLFALRLLADALIFLCHCIILFLCCEVCRLAVPRSFRVMRAPVALLPMLTLKCRPPSLRSKRCGRSKFSCGVCIWRKKMRAMGYLLQRDQFIS